MKYCNVKIEKLIKVYFGRDNKRQLQNIYDAFFEDSHEYPIVNSMGYYRRAAIKEWVYRYFPDYGKDIKDKAVFELWFQYNKMTGRNINIKITFNHFLRIPTHGENNKKSSRDISMSGLCKRTQHILF